MVPAIQKKAAKRKAIPYLFISPGLIAMLLAVVVPGIFTIYFAFTNYSLTHLADYKFSGLLNFRRIFIGSAQGEFLGVLSWTAVWAILSTFLSFSIGLILALLLTNKNIREKNFYRMLLILPWALPSTLTVLTWRGLLNSSFGPINRFLAIFNIAAVPWLTEPLTARITCLIVNIWIAFPFMMITCLGALQSIPDELYDAGKVDGANFWQSFWNITFPLLKSATLPLIISGFAMQFGNFGVIYLLTEGGPFVKTSTLVGSTDLLSTFMYKMAFASASFDYGMAAACGLILFMIVGTLTLINTKLTGVFKEADV
jgi:arabinogalactan oligomer/maltooligosaccharide transport system permease protein